MIWPSGYTSVTGPKNRWRLLFLTPFRIQLIKMKLSNRLLIDEQLTLFYLSLLTLLIILPGHSSSGLCNI